jgi:putative transposase
METSGMLRTYRYRLYPNRFQCERIRKTLGACRFVYNWALETKKTAFEKDGTNLSWYDLNILLTALKKDKPFLREPYSQSLQQAVKRLHRAFENFLRRTFQSEGKQGYPKFRRRKFHRQSFTVPQFFTIDFEEKRVKLPMIGWIKTVFHRRFKGTARECTVVSTNTNKFFICIVVEDGKVPPAKQQVTYQNVIGIDVGLKTYATLSTGEKFENPKNLQNALKRLQCLHRRLSKKKRGSKNQEKARWRLARYYERVTNKRSDFLHKLSTQLIRENQAIIVESLNIRGLMRNHRLARSIADVSWYKFLRMLQYKAEWYGVTIIELGRFEPTSKRCHVCGFINNALTLSNREWICSECYTAHDRDINAAQNIKLMGFRFILSPGEPREEPVELSAIAETSKQETPSYKAG